MAYDVAALPALDRTRVMGVLNVTPNSFSDGGQWWDTDRAVAHGLQLRGEGCDIVDVGGESTRPGAERPPLKTERDRVLPVVRELTAAGVTVSVDTMRAEVARECVAAGAVIVNDVSGGLADPEMLSMVADTEAVYVCMHWRGHSVTMQQQAAYADVVGEVRAELAQRVEVALAAGVDERRLVLDPGLGFAKDAEHDWALLGRLDALSDLGYPLLVGASRKRFIGRLLADPATGEPRPAEQRDDATATISALAAAADAWCVRVHRPAPTADAVRVVARWRQAAATRPGASTGVPERG